MARFVAFKAQQAILTDFVWCHLCSRDVAMSLQASVG